MRNTIDLYLVSRMLNPEFGCILTSGSQGHCIGINVLRERETAKRYQCRGTVPEGNHGGITKMLVVDVCWRQCVLVEDVCW